MSVVLSKYRDSEYKVEANGVLKCKHMPEAKARALAFNLAGGEKYIDETKPRETKPREAEPREAGPRETKPGEARPRETKPRETKPRETKPKKKE